MRQLLSGLYVPDATDTPDITAIGPNWSKLDAFMAGATPPQIGVAAARGTQYAVGAMSDHVHQGRHFPASGAYGLGGVTERRISGTMNTGAATSVYTCPAGAVAIFTGQMYTTAASGTMSGYAGPTAIAFGSANSTQFTSRTITAAGVMSLWIPPLQAGDQLWLTGPASTNYYLTVFEITTAVADGIVVPKIQNAAAATVTLYSPPAGKAARALMFYNGSSVIVFPHIAAGASAQTTTAYYVNNGAAALQMTAATAINAVTGNPGSMAVPLAFPLLLASSTDAIQFGFGAAGVNMWGLYQTF